MMKIPAWPRVGSGKAALRAENERLKSQLDALDEPLLRRARRLSKRGDPALAQAAMEAAERYMDTAQRGLDADRQQRLDAPAVELEFRELALDTANNLYATMLNVGEEAKKKIAKSTAAAARPRRMSGPGHAVSPRC